jgi:hypothetical protein
MIIRHEFQLPHLKHGIQSAKVLFASVANLSKPPLSKLSSKGCSACKNHNKVKQTNPSLHCKCKDMSLNKTIFHLLLGWKQAARTHKHATAHPLKMHVTVHCILFCRLSMWCSFQSNKIASKWKEECLPLPQEPKARELHMKPLAEKEKYNYKGLS